jgi:hypothetical protein
MKRIALAFIVVFGMAVAGCATFPKDDIEVAAEAGPNANFGDYKTYAWLGSAQVLDDPEGKWEAPGFDIDSLVTALIDKELTEHGLQKSDANPDTLVAYAMGADMANMKLKYDATTKVDILQNVPQAALVVVLLDANTEEVSWAAVATGEVKNKGDEIAKQRISYTIKEMFKNFPKK